MYGCKKPGRRMDVNAWCRIKAGFVGVTIFLLAICMNTIAYGAEEPYHTVAANFLKFKNSDKTIISTQLLRANALDPDAPPVDIGYLVNLSGGGYILTAVSKEVTPVKAYGLNADFDTLPGPYRDFLLLEAEHNARAVSAASRSASVDGPSHRQWDFLLNFASYRSTATYSPDTHLLTTRWNQDFPYNKYLPEVVGEKVMAGCVGIAMAQVMKYHGHPARGSGVSTYTWNGQILKTVLFRPYNWTNMPDRVDTGEPEYKVDEVARLVRDLGIVNHTSFDPVSSGALVRLQVLAENFGYAANIKTMRTWQVTDLLFFNTLRNEIDELRPLLLEFPGHLAVADGYRSDPSGTNIHVNFGWGGHEDDYYYLDKTIEAGSGAGFEPNLTIFYDIKPCAGSDCATNLENGDNINGFDIAGRFDTDVDNDVYPAYLKGQTSISGDRGYLNQAFCISLFDGSNVLVAADVQPLAVDLPAGKYSIGISLQSECDTVYAFDDHDEYIVSITSQTLTEAERAAVDESLDFAPVIHNEFKDILLDVTAPEPHRILVDARDENGGKYSSWAHYALT